VTFPQAQRSSDVDFQDIAYETIGPVARISHNRPEAGNAESQRLLDEMDQALKLAVDDPDVRVIVIAGRGKHFSSGHDLKEGQVKFAGFTVEQRYAHEELYFLEYGLRIWDCPKPTIAEVRGACIAGGFMVANMCDLVVASEDAFFSDPVCKTLACAAVELLVHPWVMGMRRAKEFLYTGRRLGAREAYEFGMVNRVVPREQLEQETMALAQDIAATPPFALKLTKRSLNRTFDIQGFRNALSAHFDIHQLAHVSEEFREVTQRGYAKTIPRPAQ
jgi:enoyl-CoA hydratase